MASPEYAPPDMLKSKENDGVAGEANIAKVESEGQGQRFALSEKAGTRRDIGSRQAQMLAIGGTIGTGLFVGSGQALATGGPGILLAVYCLMSLLVYGVVTAVVEIGTFSPVSGCSMSSYCTRMTSRSLGFALGWLYVYSFGILAAEEITTASIVINYWPQHVPIAVWITIMLCVIVGLNLCPVGVYAESEFWFASLKVILILGLLMLSLVLMLGGGPNHTRLGFHYWNDPGAVHPYIVGGAGGRFTSFLYTWVFTGFSFYFGPELIVFTAGEMRNPRKNLPKACRRFFYRLTFFYVLSSIAIGAICSSTAKGLTTSAGNANGSPWVIAIRNAGIGVLPSIVNAGILTSAWSAGNSYLYMASRSLYSLALIGNAPGVFKRCNRYGLPYYAVMACSCLSLLAYLSCSTQAGQVFNWFVSLTNTGGFMSWTMCCITYIRFRKARQRQGVAVPYQATIQPYAAWICLFFFVFLLLANGFTLFFPGRFTASGFLTTYIGIVAFIVLWLGHKFTIGRKDRWLVRPEDVDLVTGQREVEADADMWTRMEEAGKEGKHKWWHKVSLLWG
ncbi:proline permease PrnB [Niveomyces insectorum RCEF 264]|uniref:Proline permease PrnB n=1 Tax=Niveomyces insectorum RCEF 264 TaxID=1081102 RepID=A0A167W8Z3_9HYPO|nr:proline permease PrnB [Niveomyces insectorum RCEF 264]